jgi:hypothetical protein
LAERSGFHLREQLFCIRGCPCLQGRFDRAAQYVRFLASAERSECGDTRHIDLEDVRIV